MIINQNIYTLLIFLVLVTIGFFGSLSHIFSLLLIILILFNEKAVKHTYGIKSNALILYSALTGCFFLFFIIGIFRSNLGALLHSLSPLLPLPFIGILTLFHYSLNLRLKSKEVAQFSQISILFSLITYLVLSTYSDSSSIFYIFHADRLMLFSEIQSLFLL